MMSTSYTRGHHQRQGWLRWDWVVHQARKCSCPVPTYHCSSGEDFSGKLQFKVYFGHGRLQKLRSHLYIAIPSKPDTEARGPGQIWTQKTFLISLFSNYWLIKAHLPLWGMRAGWWGLQKVSTGWRTLSPQGWTPPEKQSYWLGPLFVCSLILTKNWQSINVKTFKDAGRNFKFG